MAASFHDDASMPSPPAPPRAPRQAVFMNGQLACDDDDAVTVVRVRNLSTGGALIETVKPLVPGQRIRLNLHNIGDHVAVVVWTSGNHVGLRFAAGIDPDQTHFLTATHASSASAPSIRRPGLRFIH